MATQSPSGTAPHSSPIAFSSRNFPATPNAWNPIILIGKVPNIIAFNPDKGYRSVRDLLDGTRRNSSTVTFASAANGTSGHLTGELLAQSAKATLRYIPNKASVAATTDVVAGRVDVMIDNIPSIYAYIKDRRLKPLAVTGISRSPLFPDVPTVAETVSPGFESVGWRGLVAPAGTPKAVTERLNAVFNEVFADPAIKKRLLDMGFEAAGGTPSALADYASSQSTKWEPIIRAAKIELN